MQVVNQLEIHLQKERERLQAMMQHLHLTKQLSVVANMTVAAAAVFNKQRDYEQQHQNQHNHRKGAVSREEEMEMDQERGQEEKYQQKMDKSKSEYEEESLARHPKKNFQQRADQGSRDKAEEEEEEHHRTPPEMEEQSSVKQETDKEFKTEVNHSEVDAAGFTSSQYFLQNLSKMNPLLQTHPSLQMLAGGKRMDQQEEERMNKDAVMKGHEMDCSNTSPNVDKLEYNEQQQFLNYHQNIFNLNSTIRKAAAAASMTSPVPSLENDSMGHGHGQQQQQGGPIRRRITDKSNLSLAGGKKRKC